MKSIIYKRINIQSLFCWILLLIMVSCSTTDDDSLNVQSQNEAVISLSLRAASNSINADKVLWEDRVDEIRMIVFDAQTNGAVYNGMLSFPNGFNSRSTGVRMTPGTYNFYFFANESAYGNDFATALASLSNESDFQSDTRFENLQYNANFAPGEKGTSNKFLMSAIYENITVTEGGTKENPTWLAIPGGSVELIRALAKVEVIFRKKVSGSSITPNSVESIQLSNVATQYSVPPTDNYYAGQTGLSNRIVPAGFNYSNDSIGAVIFYIPEFLRSEGSTEFTVLNINDKSFAVESDDQILGLIDQRRTIESLSAYSVIRNYHYQINAYINTQGGIEIQACVEPWTKGTYKYVFNGDKNIEIPPIDTNDSTLIIDTDCGKIQMRYENEVLNQGLQGAYGDQVIWWDPAISGPRIQKGNAPYYCEQKYGKGWRLMNSCELMSFLALFDKTYKIWESNTWEGINNNLPFFPLKFRQEAQSLLEKLTGVDLSHYVLSDNGVDPMGDDKLGIIDQYFTPGDIMLKESDYPSGWPYAAPPNNQGLKWYPSEVVVQVKEYWYEGYIDITNRDNWDTILYQQFVRYDYSRTVSRCVRPMNY